MTETRELEQDLSYYVDVLLRRRWIILSISAIVVMATAIVTFMTKPVYQAGALLVIEKERGGGAVYAGGALVDVGNEDYYQTQYKLLQSDSLTQKVYDELGLASNEDFKEPHGLKKLHAAVTVAPVLHSRLLYVRVESHDPKLAAAISNQLAQDFVEQNLANQLFISKDVLHALQVNAGDKDARRVYEALPAVVNNSLIQNLKAERARLDAQAADMAKRYTPLHPAMQTIHSHLAALDEQIAIETDKIVQSLKTELSGQLKGNNVRVVDPAAVPDLPIRPRKRFNLMLGLLAGLGAGIGLALLIEALDQSIRTQDDVEKRLALPFLGMVPHFGAGPKPSHTALLNPEPSLTSEAFKNLRTMVDFAGLSDRARTMLVTSAVQAEGKTYVASNLACVFAQLGEKVLLIDGDMRRPNLHRGFGISGAKGLSHFLAGSESLDEVESSLQDTDFPGLKVLACGPRPPNPSELLNTPRVEALIAWAAERFDRVIIDCPPMFPISDTLLWGRNVKSAVYVVQYGTTRVPLIRTACQRMETAGIKILGVAVNGAKPRGLSYSSYGYYYQQYYHDYYQAETGKPS